MAIPKQFKVSVLEAPKKMVLKTIKTPAIGPDEMLVKVEGCGICGTDVHEYKGDPFKYCPVQLGHEGTGEIVALGKNVKADFTGKPLKVGDKIVTWDYLDTRKAKVEAIRAVVARKLQLFGSVGKA